MTPNSEFIDQIFKGTGHSIKVTEDEKYKPLGLKFNPFPRSGTTNINGSDLYNQKLFPVDTKVMNQIADFISHALSDNHINPEDKFISATITGNYGSGKTQLLMFVKYILGEVASAHKGLKNPYVIYIDNPGVKLLEFIGSIISKIGEENFRKFIWNKIITEISKSNELRSPLKRFERSTSSLFGEQNNDPYSPDNMISYKKFLDAYVNQLSTLRHRKEFDEVFKKIIIKVLEIEVKDTTVAQYFYEIISDDYGVNKTWEALSSGSIKQLDRKESDIIKYIVRLIKEQGYTDFFILVDEFEDITEGRLTKVQVDNYVYNLRTLLDDHREWCLLFAMTGQALVKLRSVSPPLADRIATRLINLQDLNFEQAKEIVKNYLAFSVRDDKQLNHFTDDGVRKLNQLVEGNARKFLKNCYFMVEKAVEHDKNIIDESFITTYYSSESI